MLKFRKFLFEGGNLKVGDVHAAPFPVTEKNRKERNEDIHHALSSIHDSFHNEHGHHLFGEGKKALHTKSAYSGSSKDLMSKHISDKEFAKHKPKVGDVDVQIPKEHGDKLAAHLTPGKKFGKYTVAGTKKHGTEVSAIMKHDNGEHHQFDFEKVKYEHNEPTEGEQFLHSSNWEDTKKGIKGLHHKALINAVAGNTHKFSISHGLRPRVEDGKEGITHPHEVSKKLFGDKADHEKIKSFHGVTDLIKKHVHPSLHQEIYDKFKSGMEGKKSDIDHGPALEHLKHHLGVKDTVKEEAEEETHHTSVVPLVGFSPISHMGHAHDLGGAMKKLPGHKHIGISSKADVFSPEERAHVLKKQWGQDDVKHHVVKSGGETIGKAYHALPKHGKKVLHILVGADRKDMAHGLKKSLEAGKIKEMEGHHFDEIHIHHPDDEGRSHGMSGTKMRTAAAQGDAETFSKHVGPAFTAGEKKHMMGRVSDAIKSGKLAIKR
jgi:hypothetical protein